MKIEFKANTSASYIEDPKISKFPKFLENAMSIEYMANQSAVYVEQTDKARFRVILEKGKLYNLETKNKDGSPNELNLKIFRNMLSLDLIRIVDTRPIDEMEIRG